VPRENKETLQHTAGDRGSGVGEAVLSVGHQVRLKDLGTKFALKKRVLETHTSTARDTKVYVVDERLECSSFSSFIFWRCFNAFITLIVTLKYRDYGRDEKFKIP
jgi:hypothetical protein